ncbi:hypothetical protein DFA_07230 [Cavenderia fasciculata]|uniref:Transmembrane protein n=1 Tax=Cavenderia fasciculata TaxID=261658 RepID=F4PVU8_CACFS|nr:uncharacterized protein DFA_07230 [Cavenderia fasciculata]EGG20112.1 hypothetical protein DFA_07230 [Cavenderia fasciculata]|eukprot:XP_004367095.1 hypothetical protein DFA_07230 [Cavenderia fasciculata]
MVFQVIQPGRNHTEKIIKETVKSRTCCSCMDSLKWQCFFWLFALASVAGLAVSAIIYKQAKIETEEYWDNYSAYDSGTSPVDKEIGSLMGVVFGSIIVAGIWFWRFIMSFCGGRASGLRKMKSVGYLVPYVEQLRATKPSILVNCESYHWETRTRTVTTYVNGQSTTRTETYQEKVTTHREANEMFVSEWADLSPPLDSKITTLLLEVYFTKDYTHMDPLSEQCLETVKSDMTRRNKPRDTHFNLAVSLNVADFSDSKLFCLDESRIPWYANSFWWAIITFLWFPWEIAYRSNLATSQFDILKHVRITGTVSPLPLDDGSAPPEPILYLQLPGTTHGVAHVLVPPGTQPMGPTILAPNGHLYTPQQMNNNMQPMMMMQQTGPMPNNYYPQNYIAPVQYQQPPPMGADPNYPIYQQPPKQMLNLTRSLELVKADMFRRNKSKDELFEIKVASKE